VNKKGICCLWKQIFR